MNSDTSLTLTHYKEPLKAIPAKKGFGYYGALLSTVDGSKVQCHICGKLFDDLGKHVVQGHKTLAPDYRKTFQLARKTALVSEAERERRKERTMRWWFNMTADERREHKKNSQKKYREWQKKNPNKDRRFTIKLETKNKRGTCPDQLLAKIIEVKNKLGHTPSKKEFIVECDTQRFMHLIYKTFGSYVKAVKRAGLEPATSHLRKGIKRPRYSEEELLDHLSTFYLEQRRPPTESDSRRGFIPSAELYRKHFGGFIQARERAGIFQRPSGRWGIKRQMEKMLIKPLLKV